MLRLLALALFSIAASSSAAQPADLRADRAPDAAVDAALSLGTSHAVVDPAWAWSPAPQWLEGVPFGYPSFGGGLDYGYRYFLGSSVSGRDVVPVEIVFDADLTTQARVFRRDRDYADDGVGTFRGAAYDVSTPSAPRRLNVGFVEDGSTGLADRRWQPDASSVGGREYLLVFASSYDGDGTTYAGQNARRQDILFGLSPRLASGATAYEVPATLALAVSALRDVTVVATASGTLDVRWVARADVATVRVTGDTGNGAALLAAVDAGAGRVSIDGLDPESTYTVRLAALDGDGAELATESRVVRPALSRGIVAARGFDPGRSGGRSYGDLWGYTAPDGTEYALLAGRGAGLSILDIAAAPAADPVEVGFVPTQSGASDSKDVKVYGHHAYLVNEYGPIQIIDLTDPASPTQVGTLDTQPGVRDGGAHNVAIFDGHLWVTGGRQSGNAGVRVYDVRTTPEAPAFVGEYRPDHHTLPYYHDFEVKGNFGFGPNIYGGGVDILDVSDPAAITLVSTWSYPNSGAHNTCASEDGQTLYVGDEIGSAGNWTRIVDISDPEDAEFVGDVIVDDQAVVHNCYVRGDRLYIAHYTEGLRIFDIGDPRVPVEVAFYDTYPRAGFGFSGAWTVYPYFASGKLIVSDMQSGLFVVDPDGSAVASPFMTGTRGAELAIGPNPTHGRTSISLQLSAPAPARLSLFDVQGRELRVLLDETLGADTQRVDLDTADLAPGVYLVRLAVAGEAPVSRTLTVAR